MDDADRDRGLETTEPESMTEDSSAPRAGTILVVDDEPALRRGLVAGLAAEGYRMLEADHSAAAYEHLGREVVDLVLLDLRLGEENGFEVLAAIRADWPDSAVIMLTAHGELSTAVEAIKLGAFDFFPKPFDFESVKTVLGRLLAAEA